MASLRQYSRSRKQLNRKSLKIHDLKVSYHQQGAGPDLLLISTSLVTITTYMQTVVELAKHFRVTAIDAPGSGGSSPLRTPWSFVDCAKFLCEVTEALQLQNPWLVGHSQSCAVAAHMLQQRPDLFSGAILTDAIGAHPSESLFPIVIGRVWDALLEPALTLTATHHVLLNIFKHFRNFWFQVWNCRGDQVSRDLHGKIAKPVMLAWGVHDHTMPLASIAKWKSACPHAETYISPKASHDLAVTEPQEITAVILGFTQAAKF